MKKFCFLIFFLFAGALEAQPKLITDWVEYLGPDSSFQAQTFHFTLTGMSESLESKSFFVAGPGAQITKRSFKTGEILWSAPLEAVSQNAWLYHKGSIYGADVKGNLYCFDASTGSQEWKKETKGLIFSDLKISKEKLFVLSSYGVLEAYSINNGQWLWQQGDSQGSNMNVWTHQAIATAGDRVLGAFPSGLLQAYEGNGNRLWSESFVVNTAAAGEVLGLNSVVGLESTENFLLASSFNGNLKTWRWMEGKVPSPHWEKELLVHTTPNVSEDHVFVGTRKGKVLSINLDSGFVRWEASVSEGLPTALAKRGSNLWVSGSDGRLRILDTQSGKLFLKSRNFGHALYQPVLFGPNGKVLAMTSGGVLRSFRVMNRP